MLIFCYIRFKLIEIEEKVYMHIYSQDFKSLLFYFFGNNCNFWGLEIVFFTGISKVFLNSYICNFNIYINV